MRDNKSATERLPAIERTLFVMFAAWLTASSILNLTQQNNNDYFTLKFAGLSGLFPLMLLCIFFSGLYFYIQTLNFFKRTGKDIAGRLLFFSWLFFGLTLLERLKYTLPVATLLILGVVSLILARAIFRSAWTVRWLPDVLLSLAGISLLIANLWFIPWSDLKDEIFVNVGIEQEAILPLIIAYLGIILIFYVIFSYKADFFARPYAVPLVMLLAMALQIFLSGRILYARYESLSTPTYDFNLFAQMFHSMSKTLEPITTLERNMPLSHFKVHISPIFYLMLPFYQLFKTPAVLQILQAVIVGLGIIPLFLIAKEFKLSIKTRIALSIIYLFSTAYIASNFYDLHENCFLPVMLLWLIYFLEKRNAAGIAIFTLLTLLIKEDAALYIWALAVYVMLDYRMIKTGLIMLLGSGGYFIGAVKYLQNFGDGAMIGRFNGLIGVKQWSILAVPYSVFRNPGFVLSKIFGEGKLSYLFQMLGPLAFTPLFSRKLARWVLIIPFLLMNLMVDYPYQYDIRFQYNYGTYTLLLYLSLLFFRDLSRQKVANSKLSLGKPSFDPNSKISPDRSTDPLPVFNTALIAVIQKSLLVLAMSTGVLISMFHILDYEHYPKYLKDNQVILSTMKAVMDKIPQESSVLASPFITGYLSQRDTLYDLEYNLSGTFYYRADYIVIDLRPEFREGYESNVPQFIKDGYSIETNFNNQILVLKLKG